MTSANRKKTRGALRTHDAHAQDVQRERDVLEQTEGRNFKGNPGLVKDDRSAGTQGKDSKPDPGPRG